MKITVLNGFLSTHSYGLEKAVKIITQTLSELGVDVVEVPLAYSQIPYFDGMSSKSAESVMRGIRESDGVVFAASVSLYAPSALMQTFLEYFEVPENKSVLTNKHCFLLAVSGGYGEARALEYMVRAVNSLGGYDSARLGLTGAHLSETLGKEGDPTLPVIERTVEDYYRIVRQNRTLIIPGDHVKAAVSPLAEWEYHPSAEPQEKVPLSEVYQKLDLDAFTEQQEQDIQEITDFLAKKYSAADEVIQDFSQDLKKPFNQKPAIKPRAKTCRQMTQSLPHYYQPQMSGGLTAVIQINVSGGERFDGYLTIGNGECGYMEGIAEVPDITILSDAAVWSDVVKGKQTAQKAFMIGRLKVRGNFVLLTKFEQLFKPVL